jgi:hypothetical protein
VTYLYTVFVDDHKHGAMRLVASYLSEYAAESHARSLSPNGDGIAVLRYQLLNAEDLSSVLFDS